MTVAILLECDAEGCSETMTLRPKVGPWADLEITVGRADVFWAESGMLDIPDGWQINEDCHVRCPRHPEPTDGV